MRLKQERNTSEQPDEQVVIMCPEEIGFSEASVADAFRCLVAFACERPDDGVALAYADPRGSPYIKCKSIGCIRCKIGALDGFYAIVTTASSDFGIAGYDVERPDAHVIEVG